MRMATGIDTLAYSNRPRNVGIAGKNLPIKTPTAMHTMTHIVRYRSKKPIPGFASFDIALPPNFLQYLYHFVCFEDFTKRYYLTVHNQRGRGHHAIGGDLREVGHVVDGGIHAQLSQSLSCGGLQRVALGAAASEDFHACTSSFRGFSLSHAFSVTVSTTAAGGSFLFFFVF